MKGVLVPAACRALAGIAVIGGVLAAVEIAGYKQRGDMIPRYAATSAPPEARLPASWFYWVTPWWAYAVAVVVGLLGLALAVLIYRAPSRGPALQGSSSGGS